MKPQTIGPADDEGQKIAVMAIRAGLSPPEVEAAYQSGTELDVAGHYGIKPAVMRSLAVRWGIVE